MLQFEYFTPTKIIFGRGKISEVGKICSEFGKRAIIISGMNSFTLSGAKDLIFSRLKNQNINFIHFEINGATTDNVHEAINAAFLHNSDVVIGVGGGCALDVAKVVALGVANKLSTINDLIGQNLPTNLSALPIVSIATTAGTGSEVTKGAIIHDLARHFKSGVRGDVLFPCIAIIDPSLTSSCSLKIARESAFDALTHAIESYVARKSNPISDALALQSLYLLSKYIPNLITNSRDIETEDGLALASMIGGLNVANCGTCLPHRFEQAMAALYKSKVSHGLGLALTYKAWLKHATPYASAKFKVIASIFKHNDIGFMINEILLGLNVDQNLTQVGFVADDIAIIIKNISGMLQNDPIENIDESLLNTILLESL